MPKPDWLISPESVASPGALAPRDPRHVAWYLPGWGERLRLMGWRNVLWLPPLAVGAGAVVAVADGWVPWMIFAWWKVGAVLVGLPVSAAVKQARAALQSRTDPFCIHCGYSLTGLADGQACPECGEVTSHAFCREYQRDPHAFIDRFNGAHVIPPTDAPFEIRRDAPLRGDGT